MRTVGSIRGLLLTGALLTLAIPGVGQDGDGTKDNAPELGSTSTIRIIKQAAPESGQVFGFAATGAGISNFTLVDDGTDNDATPNNIAFNIPLLPGQSGAFTVQETSNGFYDLTNLSCSVTGTGGSSASPNLPASSVSITLQFGDLVTCTFFNSVVVAAGITLSGRAVTADGVAISRTRVTVTDVSSGDVYSATTNGFGYYAIEGLVAGRLYVVTAVNKRYDFEPQFLTMDDSIQDFDLVGN